MRGEEEREEALSRQGREDLFKESIHAQLENLTEKPKKKKRKRRVSLLAMIVAGAMVLSVVLRFLLGL